MSKASRNYLAQEIKTNHPIKNTIMMYEGCIAFLKGVEEDFSNFKFRDGDEKLEKTSRILMELASQLNEKDAPELSNDLILLYEWIYSRIDFMRMTRTKDDVPNLIKNFTDLAESFKELLKKHEAEQSGSAQNES